MEEPYVYVELQFISGRWVLISETVGNLIECRKQMDADIRDWRHVTIGMKLPKVIGAHTSTMSGRSRHYSIIENECSGFFEPIDTRGIMYHRLWVLANTSTWKELKEDIPWLPLHLIPLPAQYLQQTMPFLVQQSSSEPSSNTASVEV